MSGIWLRLNVTEEKVFEIIDGSESEPVFTLSGLIYYYGGLTAQR